MTTPTPLARARFFALLALFAAAAVPPSSAAPQRKPGARAAETAVEWVEVRYTHAGKTYVYYHPKNKPYTNDGGHERINLYTQPVLDDSKVARSHLWRKPGGGPNAPFSLHLITEKAVGAASDLVKNARNWTASAYRPPAPPPAPPAPQPAPPAPQPAPPAPQPAPAQPVAAPADPAGGTTVPRPDAPADINNGIAVGQDGGPPQRLREAMKQGERWQDVAKRIVPWAWEEKANGRSFITPDARKSAEMKTAFEATMNTVIQDPGHWASAINVYYILGPGAPVPAWVMADPELKKILVDDQVAIKANKLDELLVQCLDRWQHNPKGNGVEKCDTSIDRTQARLPYPAKDAAKWAPAFLVDAGREALWLRDAVSRGTGAIGGAIDRAGNTTTTTPDGGGRRNTNQPVGDTGSFGVDQLFGAWGAPNVFSLDGRTLALVVRTKRTFTNDDPPRPVLKNQLGLYDISNSGEIYGMRFDVDKTGENLLSLKSGGKQYKITMTVVGDDTKIDIARAQGDAKPVFGGVKQTFPTVNELFRMRAEKALNSAQSVVIGGETYRVTAESAGTGNLLFWSEKDLQRQRDDIMKPGPGGWARNLSPFAMAEVNKVVSGATVNPSETVSLGFKAGGQWQGLRYNKEAGIWIPGEGGDFAPPKPATTPTTPTTPPTGGTPTPGNPTTPGTPGGPAPTPSEAEAIVAKLNAELGPEAVKRVVFFVPADLGFGRHLGVGRRGTDGKPIDRQMSLVQFPGLADGGTSLRAAMHKGRYLISSTDKGFQVDDMMKYDYTEGKIYGTVGVTLAKDKVVKDVTDKEALVLVLAAAGFQASSTQIMANFEKAVGNTPVWTVYGTDSRHERPALNVLLGTSKCVRIFPKYDPSGCNGDESVTDRVPGAGNGMALDAVGGATQVGDTGFLESTEIGTTKVVRVEPRAARAALYLAQDGDKKNWYITFLIKPGEPKDAGDYKRTHVAFRNAKSEASGVVVEAPPSDLHLGGVTLKGALTETSMKASASESGELAKAGFIGAYIGSNGTCVGVVAWWGTDLKTACDRCGAKMAGNACVEK